MAAAWPEYLVDDMGSTIEYHVLLGKSRRAAERALEPHDLAHAIEAAKRLSDLRNGIERTQTERLIALLDRQFRADRAFELQVARDPRQLPRRHQQIAGDDGRRIVTDRRGGGGQFNTECTQVFLGRGIAECFRCRSLHDFPPRFGRPRKWLKSWSRPLGTYTRNL